MMHRFGILKEACQRYSLASFNGWMVQTWKCRLWVPCAWSISGTRHAKGEPPSPASSPSFKNFLQGPSPPGGGSHTACLPPGCQCPCLCHHACQLPWVRMLATPPMASSPLSCLLLHSNSLGSVVSPVESPSSDPPFVLPLFLLFEIEQ